MVLYGRREYGTRDRSMIRVRGPQWAIGYGVLALAFVVLAASHLVVLRPHANGLHKLLYATLALLASGVILFDARRHRREPFSPERYPRINAWVLVAALFVCAAGVVSLYVGSHRVEALEFLESVQLLLHVGVAVGLRLGTVEAAALDKAAAVARSRTQAAERERREQLLGLLRHYVLNGLTVVEGFAERLEADLEDPQREWAAIVRRRAATTADVMTNAGFLLRREGGDAAIQSVALGEFLQEEFERESPSGVAVTAPDAFPAVAAHAGYEHAVDLLVTAVLQAIERPGAVTVEQGPDPGSVSITARPAQVPDTLPAELDSPIGSDVGLPLFLAKELFAPTFDLDVRTPEPGTLAIDLRGVAAGDEDTAP